MLPDTDLTYTINFTNTNVANAAAATSLVINDAIPANTDFKIGSVVNNLGTTGLTVAVSYSNDNGTSYAYTPVSGRRQRTRRLRPRVDKHSLDFYRHVESNAAEQHGQREFHRPHTLNKLVRRKIVSTAKNQAFPSREGNA